MLQEVNLLQLARELNKKAESNILQLGLVLLDIYETKAYEQEYSRFSDFCSEELNRSRGFISKLLTVATFLKTHQVYLGKQKVLEGLTAMKLYDALQTFPNKKPDEIIAISQTLTRKDMEEERRERKYGRNHEHKPKNDDRFYVCECGKWVKDGD